MSRYQAYPEYKDSGVIGLDNIPTEWAIRKIKYLFNIGRGRVISQEELVDQGEYPVYSSQTVNDGCLGYISTYDFDCDQITWTTDGANAGTVFLRQGKHNCTNVCGTLQPRSNDQQLKYFLYCLQYVTQFYKRPDTNGAKIMNGEMGEIFVTEPTEPEKQTIANFLDHETAKIDTLIEKQQQLIQLLKEKRQAVISHAVTKGLNPNAPMKDSGVEWLGEVPEHWGVKKLKFACKLVSTKISTDQKNVIALEDIESWTGKYIHTESEYSGEDVGFKKDDILFGKLRPYLAKVYKANDEGVAFGDLIVFRPVALVSEFCFYTMVSEGFITTVDSSTYGSKMPRASVEFIAEMSVAIPPENEQADIVKYIQRKLERFDNIEVESRMAIELMQERRTALISAAVTGKIDVRSWKIPEANRQGVKV